jgi:flagellar motor protein MotB
MVAGGVDAGRLESAGFGQERPIASNETEEGKAKNRRTELVVLSK